VVSCDFVGEVHWVDDLVVASVGAPGAIAGAIIGGRQTRRAALDEFSRVTEREEQGCRRALHFECCCDIKLYDDKPGTETFWEFDTSVLDKSILTRRRSLTKPSNAS
jgi:hypothetical protein